ncbi:MAG: T9SS type A sorting domain-containing protein [Ignavibacteria bacterium]|nr:T9SS type A sorting domain-containing protein [Ignavibacteria bacterium]
MKKTLLYLLVLCLTSYAGVVKVTFQVNMKTQMLKGYFNKNTDSVCVRGDFQKLAGDINDWQGYKFKLTDPNNDSIYTVDASIPVTSVDSLFSFKFVKNDNGWETNPNRTFRLKSGISQVLYPYYFNNDSIFVPSVTVTFQVNMKTQILKGLFNKATDSVCVRGNFQTRAGDGGDWQGYKFKMTDPNNDSIYTVDATVPGLYVDTIFAYKFVKNDNGWEPDPNRTFKLAAVANQVLYPSFFANDSIYHPATTNTFVFTADLSQLQNSGFNPQQDSILVMGLDWDNLGTYISGNRRMTETVTGSAIWKTSLTIKGAPGDSTRWKFKLYPDAHFVNSGWELGQDHWVKYAADGSTVTLPTMQPYAFGYTPKNDTITFSVKLDTIHSRYNNQLITPNMVDFIGIKGGASQLGLWGGNWTISDTANGSMIKLNDNGVDGDLVAGDHIWSKRIIFPTGSAGGPVEYKYALHYPGADTANGGFNPLDNEFGYGINHIVMLGTNRNENILDKFAVQDRKLNIAKPNGGENLLAGSQSRIFWTSSSASTVKIEFSSDNGTTWTVVSASVPAYKTNIPWVVPGVNSTNCRVKVTNLGAPGESDMSDYSFSISSPTFTWSAPVVIKDNGNISGTLTFGQAPNATNGIDASLGEVSLPPVPPAGNFDVRFELPVSPADYSMKDYRADSLKSITWKMKLQPGNSGYPFVLTWNPANLPQGSVRLVDGVTGALVNIDMKAQSSYTLSNTGISTLQIVLSRCQNISYASGWNIISIPVTAADMSPTALFGATLSSAVYGFNNGYQTETNLTTGKGYWARFNGDQQFSICGTVASGNIPLIQGWNIIGPYNTEVPVSSITTNPANIINSQFFSYNLGYVQATTLQPGKGYWVRTTQAGTIVTGTLAASKSITASTPDYTSLGKIAVSDASGNNAAVYIAKSGNSLNSNLFDLPPVPPQGIFDARFAGNSQLLSGSQGEDLIISAAQYPVTINVTGVTVRITDRATNGKALNALVKSGSSIQLTSEGMMIVHVAPVQMPTAFALSQNYPNPFNPTTTIEFAVPEKSKISLRVYNQLGQLVSVLKDEEMEAGNHQVVWNAKNFPSGVYIYELKTPKNQLVKKLLLLK